MDRQALHHIKQSITRTWQEHKLFILFLCGYTFIWGVLPSICFSTFYPDSAQNIAWGNVLSWGYDQHPPLGAVFLHLVLKVVGRPAVAVYLSSMLCFTVSYWYVYKIAREFISRDSAIAAVVISTFCTYSISHFALQYNQNTILLPFWVMSCYYFWQAMRSNKLSSWLILAVITVGSILAKYEAGLIIILQVAYLLKNFQKKYLLHVLIAVAVTLVLLIPHIHWLITTGFLPIHHALERGDMLVKTSFWRDHIYNAVAVLVLIIYILFPVILLALLCRLRTFQARAFSAADFKKKYFLPYLGFAPFLFLVVIPLLSGANILSEWGFPIFVFTIPALFYLFDISVNYETLKKLIGSVLIAHLIIFFVDSIVNSLHSNSHINFPSYQLANTANNYWQRYEKDIPIQTVGGADDGLEFYLAAYLPSHPQVMAVHSLQQSPWVNKQILRKYPTLFAQLGCSNALANQLASEQFQVKHQTCVSVNTTNKFKPRPIEITLVIAQYN